MDIAGARLEALAEVLLETGQCDGAALTRARRVADETDQRLDHVLLQLGQVSERRMAEAYAAWLDLPLVRSEQFATATPVLTEKLSGQYLRNVRALPLGLEAGELTLAVADPLDDFTPAAISQATGALVRRAVAVPLELDEALNRLYADDADLAAANSGAMPVEDDAERLKDLASEAPVIRTVNQIISRAVETFASDIHVEPFEGQLRIRFRYDGILQQAESPPPHLAPAIISRIKIMARLDIAERRMPQDGRVRISIRGQEVDLRVSTLPSLHGETIVMRILDRNAVQFDYAQLGLSATVTERFRAALDLPNGIVLVTGPTGSGKTTTLYTGLLCLNAMTRKIVTVEDPIEYQLHGVSQAQVHGTIGLSFAKLLRSILRQDPDVIMVGEIRDTETAQITVQAALTGHLVLSTLHTNSAAAAVTRLRDMGVEDYLITAVLRGVLAQRLLRRLCSACKVPVPARPEMIRRFRLDRRGDGQPITLFEPTGCVACRGTGYLGRMAVAEFLTPSPEIEQLIFGRADGAAVEQAAVAAGMVPILDAGIEAALDGDTTLKELMRSVRAEN